MNYFTVDVIIRRHTNTTFKLNKSYLANVLIYNLGTYVMRHLTFYRVLLNYYLQSYFSLLN